MTEPELTDSQNRCLEDLVRTTSSVRGWFERAEGDPADPGPDASWSVSEHALHVILAMESVARAFARPEALVHRRELSGVRLAVLTTWRIPAGKTAPDRVQPRLILPADELTPRLESARDELVPLVRELRGGEPPGYLEHALLGPMTRTEWFRYLLIHARHHERLLETRRQIRR